MTEVFTQSHAEDAIARTNDFLLQERDTGLDGDFASQQVAGRVESVRDRARDLLESVPHPKLDGLYIPLSKHNAGRFDEAATVLPGYLVLVPSAMVETGTSVFYPAVVSEDGFKHNALRLHVLKQPYRQQVRYGASVILSAAGQAETAGIGDHGRQSNDGVEVEHFATLLAAGSDPAVQQAWRSGEHVNHAWRQQRSSSVTTEVSNRLFGNDIPQATITISKQQIEEGSAMLLWHRGMQDEQSGQPESATQHNALLVVQGLGFEALSNANPRGIDDIRRLIA
ncbi:MAG: hypothetical protein JWN82_222 [Candidatus Saccharibacteria bacterium]|nr:hypothetical protein [Candidatus Saccharibacteria bacterium]